MKASVALGSFFGSVRACHMVAHPPGSAGPLSHMCQAHAPLDRGRLPRCPPGRSCIRQGMARPEYLATVACAMHTYTSCIQFDKDR